MASSAAQDQWVEIAEGIRAGLAKQVALIPALTPEETHALIQAADDAMWFETKAASFDQGVEERRRTLEREAAFGG